MASGFWKAVHSPDPDGVEGVAQFLDSAWRVPVPLPPVLAHSHPKGALVSQEAHWSSWLRPPIRLPFEVGASLATSGLWRIRGRLPVSPLLTLCLLEPPGEVFYAHVLELEQVLQASHLHLQDLGQATQKSSPVACPSSQASIPLLPPSAPSPARSPVRPTAPAPFQRSGGRSSGRSAVPGCPLEAGAQAVGPPLGEMQLS